MLQIRKYSVILAFLVSLSSFSFGAEHKETAKKDSPEFQPAIQLFVQFCAGYASARVMYDDIVGALQEHKSGVALSSFARYLLMIGVPKALHQGMGGQCHSWSNYAAYLAGWVYYEVGHVRWLPPLLFGMFQKITKSSLR